MPARAASSLSASRWLKLGLTGLSAFYAAGGLMAQEEDVMELEAFETSVRGESRATNSLNFGDLDTTLPGTSPEQILDSIPGVNVVSRDPFGFYEFGNDVRVRAFSIDDIGVTFDGVPIGNSSPRYGTPIGRIADNENLTTVKVSQGAGDVTTPAYQALGGSLQFFTKDPETEQGATLSADYGDFDLKRFFGKYETGEIYEGLTAYVSASHFEFSPRGLVGLATGMQRRLETKVKYELPDGNGSIKFMYSYNDRDDYDTLGLDWQEYIGLETGVVPEGYESDSSAQVYAAGGYTNYVPGGANTSVTVGGTTYSLGSFDFSDLSDKGRNYGPPINLDPSAGPGESTNAQYYNLWRNGRMDHLYRFLVEYDFTDEFSVDFVPYYQHKNNYGLFGRAASFATTQVQRAYAADPDRTDIWGFPYVAADGTPLQADGTPAVDATSVTLTGGDGTSQTLNYFADQAIAAPGSTPTNFLPGIQGRTGRDEEFGGFRWGGTASFTWETDNNKLLFGGWYEYDRHITERPNYNLQGGGSITGWYEYDQFNFLNYSRYLTQEVYQGWIQNTYTALDGALDIVAGVKALKLDRDADGFLDNAQWILNSPTSRSTSYEDTFLPQFGLLYRINENLEAFFNYSENLAVPDAGTITSVTGFSEDVLNPEYSENFDFGIRADYGDIAFNLQGFYLEYTDRILASAVPLDSANAGAAGNSVFTNVGGVDSMGLEGSIDYTTPIEGLKVGASFAIQETTFQEDTRRRIIYQDAALALPTGDEDIAFVDNGVISGTGTSLDGQREIFENYRTQDRDLGNTPMLTLNGKVDYSIDAWTFSISGKYFDDVYVDTLNNQPIPSYTKFDGGITYKGKEGTSLEGWSASLRCVNLLDEDIVLARGYTDTTGQVLFDRGRQFTFTVTSKF